MMQMSQEKDKCKGGGHELTLTMLNIELVYVEVLTLGSFAI